MRVVLDTNVILAALLFSGGRVGWLRPAWHRQDCRPLVSRDTAQELLRVLAYPKFHLTAEEQEELLADYLPFCESVSIHRQLAGVPICRDPHDQMFFRLAIAGCADALVSGDADVLALKANMKIPILTPREFQIILDKTKE